MTTVLIVIHLMVVLALIGLVLLQRSEGGALGIGGGGGFMTGRGAGNVLTTSTAVLAAVFFLTSIGLALLAKIESRPSDILERLPSQAPAATETETPAPPAPGGTSPSVEDILEQLRNPPAGAETPQGDTGAPATEAPVPPTQEPAPPSGAAAPGPQIPPAGSPQ
jgi:preprotein translocase subunit SecG